ncbi:uncharacterized protein B0H64DRAFT_367029 [Chaetomium fimeti]|uniref:Uncharacterized protein n=1 Tax=Chaetomium fimeti TaxID=1854472 RepID=A0AAE0H7Z3_9PEZI|nr:hypothetical protein B0H64DRAFT_367029 [Chaetomium fimeti]
MTVVLITGAGRGIGRAITEAYLARPNHTVIGSVRNKADPKYQDLRSFPVASGSKLILVSIEGTSLTDPQQAVDDIKAAGIDHVDVVIANAAVSPPLVPMDTIPIKDVEECFRTNTLSPLLLFQALKPLLDRSTSPKWMSVSSAVGSITNIPVFGLYAVSAYGISKAGLNWFTMGLHTGNEKLIAFSVHPGLVQTEMGNEGARSIGMELAPTTIEQSVSRLLASVDQATREKTSGKFINLDDGSEIPY